MYKNNNVADILQYVTENSTDVINQQEEASFRAFPEIGNAKNNIWNIIQSTLDARIKWNLSIVWFSYTINKIILKLVDENKDNYDKLINKRALRSYEKNGKAISLRNYIRS